MTKEQKQKKEIAEKTILTLYTKYINKKKETVTKTVSFLLRELKNILGEVCLVSNKRVRLTTI